VAVIAPHTVAHVVFSLGVGGQERVVLDLATAQRQAGMDVSVLVLSPPMADDMESLFRASDVPVHRLPKGPGFRPLLIKQLRDRLKALGAQVVHTHNPMPLIYGAPAGRLAKCQVVHTKHGEHRDTRVRLALRRGAGHLVDAFVAVSETTAAFAREHRECPYDRLQVICNGTDLSRFQEVGDAGRALRDSLAIAGDAFVFGSVGRFVPEKNQVSMIRALAALDGQGSHLLLAGEGRLMTAAREVTASLGLDARVHFLGRRGDVATVLSACDGYVISSTTEGLPISLIEAMASALPVVSTSVGGIPAALRNGALGVLVEPRDDAALSEGMRYLLNHPEERRAMGAGARAAALEEYGVERMYRDYDEVYGRIRSLA